MSIPGLITERADLVDYFQLGKAISARLGDKSLLPELKDVFDLLPLAEAMDGPEKERLARVAALVPRSPAVFVGYDDDVVVYTSEDGAHLPAQRYVVVLAVRNAAGTGKAQGVLDEAGPLLLKIARTLSGWQAPIYGAGPLERTAAPRRSFGPGIGIFPLAFVAPLYITGDNP